MKFDVKNRFSGEVMFTADIDCDENESTSVKLGLAVKWAFKSGANLDGANLTGANLDGASYGEGIPLTKTPLFLTGLRYTVLVMDTHIKIGCELHSTEEWSGFDDTRINSMDAGALKWWRKYKPLVMEMAEVHQDQKEAKAA